MPESCVVLLYFATVLSFAVLAVREKSAAALALAPTLGDAFVTLAAAMLNEPPHRFKEWRAKVRPSKCKKDGAGSPFGLLCKQR